MSKVGGFVDCYNDFAEIYDVLIDEDINYEKWAEKIIEICDAHKVQKRDYLDLACGTGNFTSIIGKKFVFTTAVDLSDSMLAVAEEKLCEAGIRAKVLCQNISNLKINKKFDLITCGLDSTNYLIEDSDIKGYFKSVSEHLKDDGLFIFDINTEYKIKEVLGNNLYSYDDDDVVYIWDNHFENNVVDMNLTFFVKKGQVYKRFDEFHRERAYSDVELRKYISEAGMKVVETLNAYEDNNIDDYTERAVYVIRKEE